VAAETIAEVADAVSRAGTRLAIHSWRSAAAGNFGGWQVARCLFLLNCLLGAVATEGGTFPNAWNKFVPRPIYTPGHPHVWNELTWPADYPLALNEMSFLLPHFLKEGRGRLAVYFTRVYNPVWTNPDGLSWVEVLTDPDLIGLHVALTPVWNETAYFADYILPMGGGSERHDLHSYEQYDGQWIGFRQPVLRAARERLGEKVTDTRQVNPGEVWEENEFWIELSWRIDPDGSLGIRRHYESRERPGEKLTVEEYYEYIFEHSVPGLPEAAAAEGLTPLGYMRRYGAFEIASGIGAVHEQQSATRRTERRGRGPLRARLHQRSGPGQAQRGPCRHTRRRPGRPPPGWRARGRRHPARLPHPQRAAGVLFGHPGRMGLAGIRAARLHPQPRPPRRPRARPDGAHLHLPAAGADPHPRRQRQMAQRTRAHQPAVDPPG